MLIISRKEEKKVLTTGAIDEIFEEWEKTYRYIFEWDFNYKALAIYAPIMFFRTMEALPGLKDYLLRWLECHDEAKIIKLSIDERDCCLSFALFYRKDERPIIGGIHYDQYSARWSSNT